jgi:hypothetical protein
MKPMNDVTRILSAIEQGDPHAAAERPGTVLGPYKLLQQLGEGAWARSSWQSRTSPSNARWR